MESEEIKIDGNQKHLTTFGTNEKGIRATQQLNYYEKFLKILLFQEIVILNGLQVIMI